MKKLNMLLIVMLLIPMILFAQDVVPPEVLGSTLAEYFTTTSLLAGFVVFVFQFINDKVLKYRANATWTQVFTWTLAIVVSYAGWFFFNNDG